MFSESDLGLETFLTEGVPGIGGKLRRTPEDFVVDEISITPPDKPDGQYVAARVRHRNWEANRLVRRIGSNLRVGRGSVGFAGTKDGRSVATQLMSFRADLEAVKSLEIPDVQVLEAYRSNRMISIGDLIGNRFKIRVTDIPDLAGAADVCASVRQRIDDVGGFPNFFGVQRFGSIRPITHLIGKDIVAGDFEGAVMRYVANPMGDGGEGEEARRNLQETRDFSRAIAELPPKFTFERVMVSHLVEKPDDYLGALRRLPRNLIMMFVHAYQSYMFNRMLSERMRRDLPINEPIEGDFVLPLDKNGVPDHDNPVDVTSDNIEKARRNASEGKAFVSGVLYGAESIFADGEMGEIERRVVEEEGVSARDFQIVGLREASSKGSRRELLAPVRELRVDPEEDGIVFGFSLNKGCYATCLLREFMKTGISGY
ncbi:TPA: tRNA pseudouridine(13) synthase TruD [Thermoplasmata archaeon]|nr:tRNA pseudouridine(13) synthase TruD [Thermoplasmata archaeon]